MAKLSAILAQIDSGTLLLPEFQRGYVWNRDQVRGLMRSLYLGYPVGGLLLWETEVSDKSVRGPGGPGPRVLLLDGQQRITSLYGVIQGRPPAFFEGNPEVFTGLHFDVEEQVFEFYAPSKMRDNDRWVDVTKLFTDGLVPHLAKLSVYGDKAAVYLERLALLQQVKDREFHEEKIVGPDKTVDVVVDIFNKVNSGGTKLSKGDLALAQLCAEWPEARQTMRGHLQRWASVGFFSFSLDWLLRNVTAVAAGRSVFSALEHVSAAKFEGSLKLTADYIDRSLNTLSGRLGLDHDRVLMGRGSMPVISRLLHLSDGKFTNHAEQDRVLYWYIHSALWGRHSASTETTLQQDYEAVERGGVDALITMLERWRGGSLTIQAHDFEGSSIGSRFYPLLYLLTRVNGARDMGSGLELKAEMLGKLAALQVHHIFPKALLYEADYARGEVNAIANFCFLTQETNLKVGKRPPQEYFAEAEQRHPGVLASQWIPDDPALWRVDRYRDFLAARRELLAASAQEFLTRLRNGAGSVKAVALRPVVVVDETDDVRAAQVKALVAELTAMGYAEPELDCEVTDPVTGRALAVAEAYWRDGLQVGQGQPVVLELDPHVADLPRLEELGYEVFTSVDALRGFVIRRNESAAR